MNYDAFSEHFPVSNENISLHFNPFDLRLVPK